MEHSALEGRCPVEVALDVVGGKWKPMIVWRLCAGTMRFGALQRSMPEVSQRILTLQLRELERDGLVQRTVYPEVPPRVEYAATETARKLEPVLRGLGQWMLDNYGEIRAEPAAGGKSAA